MNWDVLAIILGLALLVAGGELLVRGASRIALLAGISPLVVGLTVVAFGTSAPEAAVSIISALQGATGVAVGNVVGSNIFNILVVLGLSALVAPLMVHQQVVRFDAPLAVIVTLVLGGLILDGVLGRLDGAILFLGIITYTVWAVRRSRGESGEVKSEYAKEFEERRRKGSIILPVLFVVAGLGLLIFGSNLLVEGASAIAKRLGVSDLVIGLTIVAAGTSLPELATSVIAGIRKELDIAVGNAIGSNIFNILFVLGLSGVVSPGGLAVPPAALSFDYWIMLGVAILALPVFFSGYRIARWEGAIFLIFYAMYLCFIILAAGNRPELAVFEMAALFFLVPIALLMIATAAWQAAPGLRVKLSKPKR